MTGNGVPFGKEQSSLKEISDSAMTDSILYDLRESNPPRLFISVRQPTWKYSTHSHRQCWGELRQSIYTQFPGVDFEMNSRKFDINSDGKVVPTRWFQQLGIPVAAPSHRSATSFPSRSISNSTGTSRASRTNNKREENVLSNIKRYWLVESFRCHYNSGGTPLLCAQIESFDAQQLSQPMHNSRSKPFTKVITWQAEVVKSIRDFFSSRFAKVMRWLWKSREKFCDVNVILSGARLQLSLHCSKRIL